MPKLVALFLALVLTGPTAGTASDLPIAKPESVGMSSEQLAQIGNWLDRVIQKKQAAGFVTLVARRGKVVHHEAHGTRGLDVKDPMPLDAIFDLASMTKPLTVAAALMLLEEGRYAVNDPISDYLPEFKNPKVQPESGSIVSADREITVHDLLTHTSGVSDPRSRAETFAFPTLADYMKDVARLPLRAQPGSTWIYGDSHDVLGYFVEKVSGVPLDRFISERILQPLGMSDTHYWPPAEKDNRRAVLVVDGKDDPDSTSRRPLAAAEAKTFIGGASGLYSTAADYWRFSQMLLDGGSSSGQRLLGPKTIAWMSQNHIGDNSSYRSAGLRFGLGFAVVSDPGSLGYPYSKGSYFWGGSQGTVFWIDPAEELVGVLMVQVTPNGQLRLREKFAGIVYGAITD